jgi:type VI secretion system Hcp family effector
MKQNLWRKIGIRTSFLAAAIGLLLCYGITPSHAAYEYYVQIFGEKQGVMTTSNGVRAQWKDFLPATSYTSDIGVPVGTSTPSYSSIQIVAQVTQSLPLFLNAMISKEGITATIKFIRTDPGGSDYVFNSVDLTKARIIDVKQWHQTTTVANSVSVVNEMMTLTIDYGTIAVTHVPSGRSFLGGK